MTTLFALYLQCRNTCFGLYTSLVIQHKKTLATCEGFYINKSHLIIEEI